MKAFTAALFLFCLFPAMPLAAANYPPPVEGSVTLRDYHFVSGETLPELRIHYRTIGHPEGRVGSCPERRPDYARNNREWSAVYWPEFAGELFGKNQPLDAEKYFIVLPDGIGHGKSSKPSDGLHAKFPHYGYRDMVDAQHRLLQELGVDHERLVMGTSMGGMHTWLWGENYPNEMDALMPLASLPTRRSPDATAAGAR